MLLLPVWLSLQLSVGGSGESEAFYDFYELLPTFLLCFVLYVYISWKVIFFFRTQQCVTKYLNVIRMTGISRKKEIKEEVRSKKTNYFTI